MCSQVYVSTWVREWFKMAKSEFDGHKWVNFAWLQKKGAKKLFSLPKDWSCSNKQNQSLNLLGLVPIFLKHRCALWSSGYVWKCMVENVRKIKIKLYHILNFPTLYFLFLKILKEYRFLSLFTLLFLGRFSIYRIKSPS